MLITVNKRSFKILETGGKHIVWCRVKSGVPLFDKEKFSTLRDFEKMIHRGGVGSRLKCAYELNGKDILRWK